LGFDVGGFLAPALAASGIEFVADWSALPDGTADVVVCHHTLEHVPDPWATLESMKRVLRPAGTLLLFVPFERERRYRQFDPAEPNHHLFSWNVQTLGNLVTESGFREIQVGLGRFGYDRFAACGAHRFGLGETGFRWLRRLCHLVRPLLEVRLKATR